MDVACSNTNMDNNTMTPQHYVATPNAPGKSTLENNTGMAADAATASGRGPLSIRICSPLPVTTPTAKSVPSSSKVGGSKSRSRCMTASNDSSPPFHGSQLGFNNWMGGTRDNS